MGIRFNYIDKQPSMKDVNIAEKNVSIFYGNIIDERGSTVLDYFNSLSNIEHNNVIYYTQDDDSFHINKNTIKRKDINNDLGNFLNPKNSIIIDSTTLSYMEILTLLYYINSLKVPVNLDIFYVQPLDYTKEEKKFNQTNFKLSYDSGRLSYIKPFLLNTPLDNLNEDKASIIVFLGFEDDRLNTILELDEFEKLYDNVYPILSVPGFEYGWENISISKHIGLIDKYKLYYTPSDNPYASYLLLERIIEEINSRQIILMPFGTKPNTVATAIFMVNYKEKYSKDNSSQPSVATQFDFPNKSEKRTVGVKEIHHYKLQINCISS